jgi:hypothetical protein
VRGRCVVVVSPIRRTQQIRGSRSLLPHALNPRFTRFSALKRNVCACLIIDRSWRYIFEDAEHTVGNLQELVVPGRPKAKSASEPPARASDPLDPEPLILWPYVSVRLRASELLHRPTGLVLGQSLLPLTPMAPATNRHAANARE